ncbi:MAG: hypothetical protein K9H49_11555 [Bacteroidales bacterium]|nr:hypothetical protein [Bacteroidales bacterium]MCF8390873.1 hypothetical protein [Bacteroidales bacterium]
MKKLSFALFVFILSLQISFSQNIIPQPKDYFGFVPGTDRNLFSYDQLVGYLKVVDENSDRLLLMEVGKSPMGKPMYIAFFSAPENLIRLDELKEINKKLAMDANLTEKERAGYIAEGKVFVMATLSMHSTEVAPSQSAPLTAYELCTTSDSEKLKWMKDVVYMMIPSHNPDGMDMVVNYYNSTVNTKYEGASLPGVYHKYVGHDNNRDFVILSQEDTKVIAKIYNTEWYPQVFVEKHQMGSTGPRYFVPPNHDPVAENIDEGIWTWAAIFGSNMSKDMASDGLAGVSSHYAFDDYWPGSTETCIWKNVIGFLTEAASANIASPVYIDPTELNVSGKGLAEYKKSVNMPMPWPGGEWKLGDIVDYELVSTESILKTAYNHKKEILKFRNDLCKKQVELGKTSAPYYYILPLEQHDKSELVRLVNLLKEHGVEVYSLEKEVYYGNIRFSKGDIVVPLSQAYRAFIKEVMEDQEYPVRHYTKGGDIIKPYDIASWSLPLHNGLKSYEIESPIPGLESSINIIEEKYNLNVERAESKYLLFSLDLNESYKIAFLSASLDMKPERITEELSLNGKTYPKGSFILQNKNNEIFNSFLSGNLSVAPVYLDKKPLSEKFEVPTIALVETYFHDMDAGWTRFVFDSYHIPYKILRPSDIQNVALSEYDVIVFPSTDKSQLLEGKRKQGDSYSVSTYDPKYTKGMEKEGLKKLMEYIHTGGNIVAWGQSTGLFEGMHTINIGAKETEEFNLPFMDISETLGKEGLYCPGSLVKMKMDKNSDITAGMPEECGIFYRGAPVFLTRPPYFDMDRKVLGTFPEKEILMSGYIEKEEELSNKAVMIWLKKGEGQMVLMGFNPQFRSSTSVTYKLLFNSLLLQ